MFPQPVPGWIKKCGARSADRNRRASSGGTIRLVCRGVDDSSKFLQEQVEGLGVFVFGSRESHGRVAFRAAPPPTDHISKKR